MSIVSCNWCSQPSIGGQNSTNCTTHTVCNNCRINKRSCQSACPCCWYNNALRFTSENNICPVCSTDLKLHNGTSICPNQHKHCSKCASSGCLLCQFLSLRGWTNCNYDNLPQNLQRVIDVLDTWEKKFEEAQQMNPNSSGILFDRQDSSAMDVDVYPVSTENSCLSKTNENNSVVQAPTLQNTESNDCMVCLDDLDASSVNLSVCNHRFHRECIEKWFQSSGKQSCPTCGYLYGISKGPQPPNGRMAINYLSTPLPGFPSTQNASTIEITYNIPSGIQGPLNPHPGQPYSGTVRRAYLPNNDEGKQVLNLLQRAFDDQHIFTIGKSSTTGEDNVVTWNDIHHKTNINGGPEHYGYPDPTFLLRVRQELADKGYK